MIFPMSDFIRALSGCAAMILPGGALQAILEKKEYNDGRIKRIQLASLHLENNGRVGALRRTAHCSSTVE